MRREQKQPKTRHRVEIPDDLAAFLRDVHELIETGDDSATIESDDLLQCETAYGGLIETGGNEYGFTYFPDKGVRHKWEFELDVIGIAEIAEGSQTTLTLWGCQSEDCRCMFSNPDELCFYCDYIEDDHFGNFSIRDALPRLTAQGIEGITDQSSRDDVISVLGPPDEAGGGVKGYAGVIFPWIKYHRDTCQIHFGFSKSGGRVKTVNFLPRDWKPAVY